MRAAPCQVTADFYNADPFLDGSSGELRYTRKVYTLDFYYGGALFQSARFGSTKRTMSVALKLHTGETTDNLAQLCLGHCDTPERDLVGSLPDGNWTAPLTEVGTDFPVRRALGARNN